MTIEWRKLYRVVSVNGEKLINVRGIDEDGATVNVYMSMMGWDKTRETLRSLVEAMDNTPRDDDGSQTA
jgi:hypothetical protein